MGRVLWFYERQGADAQAAIVTYVHSDTCVNLAVFAVNGGAGGRTSVYLKQEDEAIDNCYCEWMPYQLGQAAKTEQAESLAQTRRRR